MLTTLYLTAKERSLFDGLDDELREGWTAEEEQIAYKESDERQKVRLSIMNIQDQRLQDFMKKSHTAKTSEDLLTMISDVDFSQMNDSDLTEIFYALGPNTLSQLLSQLLWDATDDSHIEEIASISTMRHLLFS